MSAFKIPTIYSIVDQMSAPFKKMAANATRFTGSLETGLARGERLFRKLTPTLSETSKQMFAFARSAVLAGAIVSGISFSIKSLMDYEDAVASFRTIVSSASNEEFALYEKAINNVAKSTKTSSIVVSNAFENIAGLNAKLAETPESISQVTEAAITLAKASKDDLGKSASNLVGILNQFNFGAEQSARVINTLAAGQAVGASNIKQTADAMGVFGAIANASNITLERSVALTEVLAAKGIYAAEAGTALRGSTLALQKAGLGYQSGVFDIVGALEEYNKKLGKLKTAKQKDAYATKVFGVINRTTGNILSSSIPTLLQFEKGVTGTSEAQRGAAIQGDRLRVKLDELQAAWVNMMTSTDKTNKTLTQAKQAVGFVTDNLQTIVSVGLKVLAFFVAWKLIMVTMRVALIAYNVVLGLTNAFTRTAFIYTNAQTLAMNTQIIATRAITAAQWLWNAAMTANPIGLIIVALAAVVTGVTLAITKWDEWGAALTIAMGPLGLLISMIQTFKSNWDMIGKAFTDGGIISGLKAIGKVFIDAIFFPIHQLTKLLANLTGSEMLLKAVTGFDNFRDNLGVNTAPLNPKAAEQDSMVQRMENVEKQKVAIDINDKTGRAEMRKSGKSLVPITLTSTVGQF